jgi:hypothetical protein
METGNRELTPEQKCVLASLSEETGEPIAALIDQVLDALQERQRARPLSAPILYDKGGKLKIAAEQRLRIIQ